METSNQRSNKRAREEIEDTNPTVLISQVATATITDETVNQNRNVLTASPALGQKHNTDGLTNKLNPANRCRRQRNSPSRQLSNSNIKNNDKYEQKIKKLSKHVQETPVEHTILNTTELYFYKQI